VSIGAVLATARHQAGLTTTQVSQRTRIREGIVRGIEADDFSACGADFYARGHIRAIAASVGTDPEPLVCEYDSSHGLPPARAAASRPGPSIPLRPSQRRRSHWGWSVALLAVLAALAGLVTYHFVAAGPAGSSTAAARTPAATAHKAARKHPAAKTTTPAPPAKAHARALVISVTAVSEPCWADLTTPGGATIFEGIVGTGTSKTWTERQAVTLKLGNPGAVTLTVDGKNRTGLGSQPLTLNLGPGQGNPG
jgi:cytoskeletal protein RodZ